MKGITEEAEVVIRFDKKDGLAHVLVHVWPEMFRKCEKRWGKPFDTGTDRNDRKVVTARWRVPIAAVTLRKLSSVGRKGKGNPSALEKARSARAGA